MLPKKTIPLKTKQVYLSLILSSQALEPIILHIHLLLYCVCDLKTWEFTSPSTSFINKWGLCDGYQETIFVQGADITTIILIQAILVCYISMVYFHILKYILAQHFSILVVTFLYIRTKLLKCCANIHFNIQEHQN